MTDNDRRHLDALSPSMKNMLYKAVKGLYLPPYELGAEQMHRDAGQLIAHWEGAL